MTSLKKRTRAGLTCFALIAMGAAGLASAGALTSTMPISLQLQTSCSSASATPLNFPATVASDQNVDAEASFTVNCDVGTQYDVGISLGDHPPADGSLARNMSNGASLLRYNVYLTAARTTAWAAIQGTDPDHESAVVPGGSTIGVHGSGADQTFSVYGRAFLQASTSPVDYNDSLIVLILF